MTKKRIPSQNHARIPPPKHLNLHSNSHNKHNTSSKFMQIVSKQYKSCAEFGKQFIKSKHLALLVIVIDFVLTINIIHNVKYTEIDWSTYMTQVSSIFSLKAGTNSTSTSPSQSMFNFDYSKIEGPTGPLVYPAGHVYIFKLLFELTNQGTNILRAQYIFAVIYIAQLLLVYKIYFHEQTLKVSSIRISLRFPFH